MKIKRVLKIGAVPAILAVGLVAMQALGSTKKESNKRELTPEARPVETARLDFGGVTLEVEGNGVVESERVLNLVSEASGKVLFAKNDLKDGTYVREGEVVVRIDSRDVENDLYALRSDYLNAVASVLPELQIDDARIYRKWFDYFNSLDIAGSVPELPEITNAQEKIKISTKDVIGKYYELRNREIQLSKYTIRAPFDGYVSSAGVIENSFVTQGQSLFTLSDARNLVVAVPLLVEESKWLESGRAPTVHIRPQENSKAEKIGRITRRGTRVDRNSQTLEVFVTFQNRDLNPNFLPGNYVHVTIEGRTLENVATVPRHLLDADEHVYTMEEGGTLGRLPVEVVVLQGDHAIIENTVPEGTVIVTTILQKPLVGMSIRSTNMPGPPETRDLAGSAAGGENAGG